VVNGPGSISNFQAGVLLTGANGFKINSVTLSNNQIGTFMTGADNAQVQQNIIQKNNIGIASHSSSGSKISSNLISANLLAGITFVNTKDSNLYLNNVHVGARVEYSSMDKVQTTQYRPITYSRMYLTLTTQMAFLQILTQISM
jgi:nitrous oxidase accessory protein NosD